MASSILDFLALFVWTTFFKLFLLYSSAEIDATWSFTDNLLALHSSME